MGLYRPITGRATVTRRSRILIYSFLISFSLFSGISCTPVGGNLLTGIANLAKSEVLSSRHWDKLTVDNDHIVAELKQITDIASEFQDGGIISERGDSESDDFYPFQTGFLCDILERLNIANSDLEDYSLKLLDFYKVPPREIEGVRTAFDSIDQSVKAIMNLQIEGLGWKPRVPQESKSWIGLPGVTGTNGGRSPQDNTLDTSVIMKLAMGNSAMVNSANMGNSLVADATPRYSSRGYIEGWGGTSRKPKERLNICDLVDGIAFFLKNDIFDHQAIFAWIWDKKDLFNGDVLINADQPVQIEKTLTTAMNNLLDARSQLKRYSANTVQEIISVPSLHAIKYPDRLPKFKSKTEEVLDIVDEFKMASDEWARTLRKLSVVIERITNDRIRSAFASKVKKGGLQATKGTAWWTGD
ncbi:hypothetical protein TWF481_005192 [Arthrobotrys musiformis]|uniref:Uncharacterized protein n=1 Tax=Arthrobotrys musiformis TaxID=47236 RepID=A0AAV9WD40_9PEZI